MDNILFKKIQNFNDVWQNILQNIQDTHTQSMYYVQMVDGNGNQI